MGLESVGVGWWESEQPIMRAMEFHGFRKLLDWVGGQLGGFRFHHSFIGLVFAHVFEGVALEGGLEFP